MVFANGTFRRGPTRNTAHSRRCGRFLPGMGNVDDGAGTAKLISSKLITALRPGRESFACFFVFSSSSRLLFCLWFFVVLYFFLGGELPSFFWRLVREMQGMITGMRNLKTIELSSFKGICRLISRFIPCFPHQQVLLELRGAAEVHADVLPDHLAGDDHASVQPVGLSGGGPIAPCPKSGKPCLPCFL